MGRLDGKVAIVTGAARGGGQVTARHFVAEGAKVIVADVLDERGQGWVGELGDKGAYVHLDITKEEEWRQAVAFTTRRFGLPTVLINNAAVFFRAPLAETPGAEFDRLMHVNVTGTFLGIKAMVEPMKAAGGGSIVNISSTSGLAGTAHCVAYTASKWAVRGLTRVAAVELGPLGIRVNALMGGGGGEMTDPFHAQESPQERARLARARRGPPRLAPRGSSIDTVAHMCAFLASDESYHCHGQDYAVDSGSHAGQSVAPPEMAAALGARHD